MPQIVVVGAALLDATGRRVLAAQRAAPRELAGRWEFPGGKVEPGEDERAAVVRECDEELGVLVEVGDRVGADVVLGGGTAVLRLYAARLASGSRHPQPREHRALRWLAADALDAVDWIPADLVLLPPLRALLARA